MFGIESRVLAPVGYAYRLAWGLGSQALRPLGFKSVFDNRVQQQHEAVLVDIDEHIAEFSARRSAAELATNGDAANNEAAEQAALPELEALRDFVVVHGPQTQEELTHISPSAQPEPFAVRQAMMALEEHTPDRPAKQL